MPRVNLKIKEIVLHNFRPYEDVTLNFSQDPKRTITIIEGTNSAGKTSIMNAIHWCLYGKEQFLNEGEGKPIPNQRILNETKVGETANTNVQITISDDSGPKYQVLRTLYALRNNKDNSKKNDIDAGGQIDSGFTTTVSVSFSERNRDGSWDTTDDESRFISKVNKILPEKLSEFVIFNGEILDTFFRSANSENIKTGIERVSGLPITQRSIEHWERIHREYSRKSATAAGSDASIIEDEIERKKPELGKKKKSIEILEKNLTELKEQEAQLEIEIQKHPTKALELLQTQLLDEKRHQKEYESIAVKFKDRRTDFIIENLPRIALKNVIDYGYDALKVSEVKGETPPPIMDFFLDELIKKSRCMCGTNLNNNKEALHALLKLKESVRGSQIANIANEGKEVLRNIKEMSNEEQLLDILNDLRKEENHYEAAFRAAKEKVNGTIEQLKEYDEVKIRQIASSLDKIRNRRRETMDELQLEKAQELAWESKIQELEEELKKATDTTTASKKWNSKRDLAEKAYKTLSSIREELLTEIRLHVQERTEEIFKKLITRHWQIEHIEIDESYKIRVIDTEGVDNLKTLSAGQTLYLALSYIAAVREVTDTNYPMIIDSPFGRIAGLERVRAAEDLPNYLPDTQITFLVTNTEYNAAIAEDFQTGKKIPSIKETLQKHDRLWKEFRLELEKISDESSRTIIRETSQ